MSPAKVSLLGSGERAIVACKPSQFYWPEGFQAMTNANRSLGTTEVLERLRSDIPGAFEAARVVGHWIWLEFTAKPSADIRTAIKALGFHWNRQREAWQHPCGFFSRRSPGNPKWKYGVVDAAAVLEEVRS